MRVPVQLRRGAASGDRHLSAGTCRWTGIERGALPQPGRNSGDPVSTFIEQDRPLAATASERPSDEAQLLTDFQASRKPSEVTKRYLDEIREALRVRNFAGASGGEIVHELTAAVDNVLRALFVYAAAEHDRRFSKLNQRLTVLARGGYGRAELNPYSDIDLLFLHDWKPGP